MEPDILMPARMAVISTLSHNNLYCIFNKVLAHINCLAGKDFIKWLQGSGWVFPSLRQSFVPSHPLEFYATQQ